MENIVLVTAMLRISLRDTTYYLLYIWLQKRGIKRGHNSILNFLKDFMKKKENIFSFHCCGKQDAD